MLECLTEEVPLVVPGIEAHCRVGTKLGPLRLSRVSSGPPNELGTLALGSALARDDQ